MIAPATASHLIRKQRDMMRPQTCLVLAKYMASLLSLGVLFASHAARSEPVTNRILSGYQILVEQKCAIVKINFEHRIRYVSHFPLRSGTELRIMLRPIDPRQFDLDGSMREALRPPQDRSLGIKAIQYEAAIAEGPTLTILFDRPVNFDAAGGADFQSLVFTVTNLKTGNACRPVFPSRAANGWETVVKARDGSSEVAIARPPRPVAIPPVPVTPDVPTVAGTAAPVATSARPPTNGPVVSGPTEVTVAKKESGANASDAAVATLIGEARDALRQGKFAHAITQLTKAVQLPESRRSPEARELLGVAYQKDRQPAAAKSVYEDYLRRYPNGDGSDGVRQRLQAIETADASPAVNLRTPTVGPAAIDGGSTQPGGRIASGSYWSVSGSLSSFYIKDDTHSVMRDPTLTLDLNSTKDDHQIHQNTVLTSFDLAAAWGNPDMKAKFRFSGTEENRFGSEEANVAGVSALFLDMAIRSWDTEFRIGRQTRNTDGVLGRFDGAVITYHVNPLFSLTALGGSPVEFRSDLPFKDDRYFYGGAVNFGPYRGFDADVYAIEQMDRSIIDRQAVGTELHYNDANKSIFATVDYDTHFNELDAAIFTGTWTFADKSVLRLGADYRKAPFLTTWNALLGQPYTTLYDLLKAASIEHWNLEQMAIDRTATYQSSTVGYSRALTDKLQINLDFTQAHIDGTITSFNVNGTPDMGDEYYYSAQLVGTGLFLPNDLYTAAFRYSDLKNSQNFAVDLSTRYPWSEALRIQPRIVAGYTEGKGGTPFDEYTLLPSLLIDYFLRKDLSFEVEVGNRWTWRTLGTTRSTEDEFLITAGFRLDFYADAQNCLTPSVFCRTSSQAAR
jgi:hypothetical protein